MRLNEMKRILCLILVFAMMLSVAPLQSFAVVDVYEPITPGDGDATGISGHVLGEDKIGVQLLWMLDDDSKGVINDDDTIMLNAFGEQWMQCMAKAILTNKSGAVA